MDNQQLILEFAEWVIGRAKRHGLNPEETCLAACCVIACIAKGGGIPVDDKFMRTVRRNILIVCDAYDPMHGQSHDD